ncbi:hypothetical protein F511_14527 [Dorcoceras hygrometricum]|uniref:Uncharacterized protein n=1 Tax=Dorcoceras hygrometricum TaxID=472368 RepID=A0A2Z7ASF3_9LAMI|nr:hypothetical protein F511_14527 [Dorcoceras hygrometricum]
MLRRRRRSPSPAVGDFVIGLVSINVTRRIRSCQNPSDLLVQIDGGIVFPIVDLIRRSTAVYLLKCRFPCETGRSQASRRQQGAVACGGATARAIKSHAGRTWPDDFQQPRAICCVVVGRPCAMLGASVARMMRPACNLLPRDMLATAATVRRCLWQRCDGYFLLGFVRACPGKPMKFSSQYSILGRFWSDQN